MKAKLITAALVGLAAIGNAIALTTDEIRAACQNSSKTIWDAKNSVCVPRAVCHSNKPEHEKYCNKFFANVSAPRVKNQWSVGKYMTNRTVNMYTLFHYNSLCQRVTTGEDSNTFGQDEYGCQLADGSYMSFEFDDLVGSGRQGDDASMISAACAIFGFHADEVGWRSTAEYYNFLTATCVGATEADCTKMNNIANTVGKIDGPNISDMWWEFNFEDNKCVLRWIEPQG